MSHIFISYSRKDLDFAQKIVDALAADDLDTWIDWKSIPKGEDWEQEIYRGIEGADAFLFLLSPASVTSEMCNKEIAHAVKNGKRILPIFISNVENREIYNITEKFLHIEQKEEICRRNFIICREGMDDVQQAITEIQETIHTDYEWLKYHTRLQVKALEWERTKDESRFLRGKELIEAEQHIVDLEEQVEPQPTKVQREYLLYSRRNEDRQRRRVLAAVMVGSILMLIVTIIAIMQRQIALKQQRLSRARELSALSMVVPDSYPQRRLLLAISALNTLKPSDPRISLFETNLRNYLDGMGGMILNAGIDHSSLVFSPDGDWLVARDYDQQVKLWSLKDLAAAPIILLDQNTNGRLVIGPPTSEAPNGKWLATGGENFVEIWDLQNPGAKPISLQLVQYSADSIAFSPDGKWLVVGENQVVEVWDTGNFSFPPHELEHEVGVDALAFSSDGRWLATGTFYGHVRLWDIQGFTLERELTIDDEAPVSSVAFSPDGNWLAVGCQDNNVKIYDLKSTGNDPMSLDFLDGTSVAFSPDGQWLATGGGSTTIQLWDVQNSFAQRQTLKGFEGGVIFLAFNTDSQWLAVQDGNFIVHLLKLHEFFLEPVSFIGDPGYYGSDIVIDDRWIVESPWNQPVQIWNLQNPHLAPVILENSNDQDIGDVVVSPDQHWLATLSGDSTWKFWDLWTPNEPPRIMDMDVLAYSPNESWLLINDPALGGSILDMNNPLSNPQPLKSFMNIIEIKRISDDGHWIVALDESETAFLWDTLKPDLEPVMLQEYGEIEFLPDVAFSPDGRWFVKGNSLGEIKVWDLQNPAYTPPRIHDTEIEDVIFWIEFSPDSRWLVLRVGYSDAFTLQILKINESSLEKIFEAEDISFAKISPRGKWLAFGGYDGIVHLLDIQTENLQVITLPGRHKREIKNLVFSVDEDENFLVSTSARDTQYTTYGGGIFSTSNDIVLWWDLRNPSSEPVQLPGHDPLFFSSDEKWLLISSDTGFLLWHVNFEEVKEIACRIVGRNFTWEEWQLYFSNEKPYKTCEQWDAPMEPVPTWTTTP